MAVGSGPQDDQETVALIMQLVSLGRQAIMSAANALTVSEAATPDLSQGAPAEAPTIAAAFREQERAFRFAACAGRIDEAVRELKHPSEIPDS